jgi:hypothetical protein
MAWLRVLPHAGHRATPREPRRLSRLRAFLDAWLSRTDWEALSDGEKDQRYRGIVLGLMDEAIEVLERHEIAVTWNRDLRSRIHLSNVDYYVAI